MVIVRDIEFASTSEADLLPFYGRCHVAYVPSNGVVLGLSKLARVTKLFSRQLQSQQRLTNQILVALQQELAPKGAAIVMEARHLAHGPEADFFVSSASSGCFQDVSSSCMQARLICFCSKTNTVLSIVRHSCRLVHQQCNVSACSCENAVDVSVTDTMSSQHRRFSRFALVLSHCCISHTRAA